MPGLVAAWYRAIHTGGRRKAIAQLFTARVTPVLLESQRDVIRQEAAARGWSGGAGFRVKTRDDCVTAHYQQDESALTISVEFSASYPLSRAKVTCREPVGVGESKWQRWRLQMSSLLARPHGTLCAALDLWRRNVDAEFDGVEPCPICYAVLELSSQKLPRLACKTCSNKFHSRCLHGWFRSSQDSRCPMCRQDWFKGGQS